MMRKSNFKFVAFALWLMSVLLLFGCSPQKRLNRKIDRAERFAQKHGLVIADTVTIYDVDTFITESIKVDTVTHLVSNDTVIVINDEKVEVRYFHDSITNNIYHEVRVPPDTIVQTEWHTVETEKIIHKKSTFNYLWIFIALIVLAFLIIAARRFRLF